MNAVDFIRANKGKMSGTALVEATIKATGCHRDTAVRNVRQCSGEPAKISETHNGKTLDSFRQTYDIPLRIEQGIKKYLKSVYMTDSEFREACGVHAGMWRRYADDDKFKANRGRFSGQLLWASEPMMKSMKRIAGIPQEV